MMENEEDNDFIGGTGNDVDTAPPMENEVNDQKRFPDAPLPY